MDFQPEVIYLVLLAKLEPDGKHHLPHDQYYRAERGKQKRQSQSPVSARVRIHLNLNTDTRCAPVPANISSRLILLSLALD